LWFLSREITIQSFLLTNFFYCAQKFDYFYSCRFHIRTGFCVGIGFRRNDFFKRFFTCQFVGGIVFAPKKRMNYDIRAFPERRLRGRIFDQRYEAVLFIFKNGFPVGCFISGF